MWMFTSEYLLSNDEIYVTGTTYTIFLFMFVHALKSHLSFSPSFCSDDPKKNNQLKAPEKSRLFSLL